MSGRRENPASFTPPRGGYRLVWRLTPLHWASSRSPEPASYPPPVMPHLVPADGSAGFTAAGMAAGILLGWSETARFGWSGSPRRLHRFLAEVLTALGPRLGHPALESLVLATAEPVRARMIGLLRQPAAGSTVRTENGGGTRLTATHSSRERLDRPAVVPARQRGKCETGE
jgi:hypothetical protein